VDQKKVTVQYENTKKLLNKKKSEVIDWKITDLKGLPEQQAIDILIHLFAHANQVVSNEKIIYTFHNKGYSIEIEGQTLGEIIEKAVNFLSYYFPNKLLSEINVERIKPIK
jgi:hypothetical protein